MTHITPEEAEAMVALVAGPESTDMLAFHMRNMADGSCDAIDADRMSRAADLIDAFAALARLREADRAEIERLTRERDDWRSNFRALEKAVVGETGLSAMTVAAQAKLFRPRAEAAEARLTALEADRVKVAETALRMAADACEDYPSTAPDRDRWEPYDDQIEHCQHAILAITPAAVLAAVDSTCTPA